MKDFFHSVISLTLANNTSVGGEDIVGAAVVWGTQGNDLPYEFGSQLVRISLYGRGASVFHGRVFGERGFHRWWLHLHGPLRLGRF